MDLQGSIGEFGLTDIVQFLSSSEKTGALRLTERGSGRQGFVFFDRGKMTHAELGRKQAEEAVYSMMLWTDGQFLFEPEVTAQKTTVRQSNANLLMEGARRKDEWAVLEQAIPDLSHVPEFLMPEDDHTGKQITLNTSEWVVLSKIDGKRNLSEIAEAAGISEFHTCRLLYSLVNNHLIKLRPPEGKT